MMTMKAVVLVAVGLAMIGCGGVDYEAENRQLRDDLANLRTEHEALQARLTELETNNREMLERLRAAGADVNDLQQVRSALETELAEARRREQQQRERLDSFRRMLTQFRDMIAAGQLRVRIVRGKMVVELPEGVLFDSARAEIKDEGQETLRGVAQILAQIQNREFLIVGHTDNVPIRSRRFPSNWELSAARGVVVARFLAENGMDPNRLGAAGYADTQPVASNDSDGGRAQNRRIEIVLMPNLDELPDLSSLESEVPATPAPVPPEGDGGGA
jgi:chemotaxis protein MotB